MRAALHKWYFQWLCAALFWFTWWQDDLTCKTHMKWTQTTGPSWAVKWYFQWLCAALCCFTWWHDVQDPQQVYVDHWPQLGPHTSGSTTCTHEIYLVAHTVDLKHWPQLSIEGGREGGRDNTQIIQIKEAGRALKSTAYCMWSVISSFSNLNRRSSSLGLFCHVPLKRDQGDWQQRLWLKDTPNAIGCTSNQSSGPCEVAQYS